MDTQSGHIRAIDKKTVEQEEFELTYMALMRHENDTLRYNDTGFFKFVFICEIVVWRKDKTETPNNVTLGMPNLYSNKSSKKSFKSIVT